MSYEAICVDRVDNVAVIRLNRPDSLNAYTTQMGLEIDAALAELDVDDTVRAIVVTGTGRAFCAGADLKDDALPFGHDDARPMSDDFEGEGLRTDFWRLNTPLIAAINGPAVGVGMTLAMQADLRVVARNAKLAFAFVRRGMIAELNGHFTLTHTVGLATALDLLLTGRTFLGDEAGQLGIAHRVVDDDDVYDVAVDLAHEIGRRGSPTAVAVTRRLAYLAAGYARARDRERDEAAVFTSVAQTHDPVEGVSSFLERRDPTWTGSKATFDDLLDDIETTRRNGQSR